MFAYIYIDRGYIHSALRCLFLTDLLSANFDRWFRRFGMPFYRGRTGVPGTVHGHCGLHALLAGIATLSFGLPSNVVHDPQ